MGVLHQLGGGSLGKEWAAEKAWKGMWFWGKPQRCEDPPHSL